MQTSICETIKLIAYCAKNGGSNSDDDDDEDEDCYGCVAIVITDDSNRTKK